MLASALLHKGYMVYRKEVLGFAKFSVTTLRKKSWNVSIWTNQMHVCHVSFFVIISVKLFCRQEKGKTIEPLMNISTAEEIFLAKLTY